MSLIPFLVPRRLEGSFSRHYTVVNLQKVGTYSSYKILAFLRHRDLVTLRVGEVDRLGLDELVHLLVVVVTCIERREAHNHLVGEDTDGPPVDRERVTLFS